MKKETLLNFIQKYYLNGLIDSVLWKVVDNTLTVHGLADGKSVRNIITCNNIELEDCELIIVNTETLISLLSALDDDNINIKVNTHKNVPMSLKMTDSAIDLNYMLGHPDILLSDDNMSTKIHAETKAAIKTDGLVPTIKFELDKEGMNRFVRSRNALGKTCTRFAVITAEDAVDLVLNYDTNNSNRITLTVGAEVSDQVFDPIFFNSDIVTNIYTVNKNCESGTFEVIVSERGSLLVLKFNGDGWQSMYLIPSLQVI